MKIAIVLALAVVGCGSGLPATETTTTWDVTLGSWETPTCQGTMTLAPIASTDTNIAKLAGSWSCGNYGRQANAQVFTDGRVFLDLETSPGFLNGVRGTLAADDAITGDILIDGQTMPFAAYRQ